MNFKKALSGMLAGCLTLSLCGTSSLAVNKEDVSKTPEVAQEFSEKDVDKYTITFPETKLTEVPRSSFAADLESADVQNETITKEHNEEVSELAKDYVLSLGLQEAGLDYIEDSCLAELEEYENNDSFMLTSYTVIVPKAALTTGTTIPSTMPLSALTKYGTYGGRDFYFYYYAEASGKSTMYTYKGKPTLQQWENQAISLLMTLGKAETAVPFSAIKLVMGMGANSKYTVAEGASFSNRFNVNIHSRGLYTLYGKDTYKLVTSAQMGALYPFIIWFPAESPKYNGSYNVEIGYSGTVYTPGFSDTDANLKEAWQAVNGATGIKYHKQVMDYNTSYYWK